MRWTDGSSNNLPSFFFFVFFLFAPPVSKNVPFFFMDDERHQCASLSLFLSPPSGPLSRSVSPALGRTSTKLHDTRQARADIYGRSCQRVPAEGDSEAATAVRRQKKKKNSGG